MIRRITREMEDETRRGGVVRVGRAVCANDDLREGGNAGVGEKFWAVFPNMGTAIRRGRNQASLAELIKGVCSRTTWSMSESTKQP